MGALALGLLALAGSVQAGSALAGPAPGAETGAGAAPDDVELVIVVDDAGGQRRTPPGRALLAMAGESGLFDDVADAWTGLARSLGRPPDEAFDRLLGSRLTFMARGLGGDAELEWALVSQVSPADASLLLERLRGAPRQIDASGQSVIALENGRYALAISGRAPGGPDRFLIVLAPAEDAGLFDQVRARVDARADTGEPLKGTRVESGGQALRGASVFAILRPASDGPRWAVGADARGEEAPDDAGHAGAVGERQAKGGAARAMVAISARPTPDGWEASVIATPDAPGFASVDGGASWPGGLFERVSDGALVASCERVSATGPLGEAAAALVPIDSHAHATLTGRAMLALHEADGGRLAVTLGLETRDARGFALAGDDLAARFAVSAGVAEPPRFQGQVPEALRAVALGDGLARKGVRWFGGSAVLRWRTCVDPSGRVEPPRAMPAALRAGGPEPGAAGPRPGWWVVNLAPADTSNAGLTALVDPRGIAGVPAEDDGLVSRTVARPAALEAALRRQREADGEPAQGAAFIGSLRWVESIDWSARRARGGLVEGQLLVRMNLAALGE